jgi:hypothetical protein
MIAGTIAVIGMVWAPPAGAVVARVGYYDGGIRSCTQVDASGFYSTVTVAGTTILVKPGGECPVPPDFK